MSETQSLELVMGAEQERDYISKGRYFEAQLVQKEDHEKRTNYIEDIGDMEQIAPHGIIRLPHKDGRVSIMVPHPERVFRTEQNSCHHQEWDRRWSWLRMLCNTRIWVEEN